MAGNTLGPSRAVAAEEVDQATPAAAGERYRSLTDVRQNYFDVLALQRRAELLRELVGLADRSVAAAETVRRAGEAARLGVVQLEVDRAPPGGTGRRRARAARRVPQAGRERRGAGPARLEARRVC